jgi:hypothetical protein
VRYASGHGTGPWGDVIRSALAAEGIAVLRPADRDRDTGFDVALVEPDAERTFVPQLGAETVRGPGGWDDVPAGPGDAVYVSGYGLVPRIPGRSSAPGRQHYRSVCCCSSTRARWSRRSPPLCSARCSPAATG